MNYFLKKRNNLLCFLFLFSVSAFTQTAEFNLKKYWYLKWRLKNYFMVEGEGYGKTLPMGIRNTYVDNIHWSTGSNFGDAPNYLAAYIGVLATEYKLLSDNNQNTSKTVEELYYALKAVIRLDNCEAQYPWKKPINKLDGACSRGDVYKGFVNDNYNALNKNLTWFNPQQNPGDPDEIKFGNHYDPTNQNPDILTDDKESGMMSHDHISSMFVALALVKKFIPAHVNYNSFFILSEAKSIADRFINYMAIQFPLFKLRNPDNDQIKTEWGGDAYWFSYGHAKAANFITPNIYHLLPPLSTLTFSFWQDLGTLSLTGNICSILPKPCNKAASIWIALNLACVGNSWGGLMNTPCQTQGIGCYEQTQFKIWKYSKIYKWQAYYPLLHAVLYDGICLTNKNTILNDLNSMPCSGHWNNGDEPKPSSNWRSSLKYHSTDEEAIKGNIPGDFQGKYTGLEYMLLFNLYCIYEPSYLNIYYPILAEDAVLSGNVPYMVPFPLAPNYLAAIGVESNHWPAFFSIPQVIHTIRSVESTAVIENKNMSGTYNTFNQQGNPVTVTITMQGNVQANVTYKAGEGITLKPGFHAKTGVKFHAYIDPLTCNSNGSNYERIAGTPEEDEDEEEENTNVEAKEEQVFTIAPNPGNGMFRISYAPAQSNTLQVEIINITGTLVYNNVLTVTEKKYIQTDINISDFAQGVYLLRLQDGDKIKTAKIVVQ